MADLNGYIAYVRTKYRSALKWAARKKVHECKEKAAAYFDKIRKDERLWR